MLTSNYVSWSHTIIPLIKTNCANLSSIKYNVVVQTYQMLSILGNPWNYQENSMTSENFVVQIVELFPTLCVWSNFEFETWIWCPFLQPIKSVFKF